jgi:hypothetical protein
MLCNTESMKGVKHTVRHWTLPKLVLYWDLHIFMMFNIIQPYELKWIFLPYKNMTDHKELYEIQTQFLEYNLLQDIQSSDKVGFRMGVHILMEFSIILRTLWDKIMFHTNWNQYLGSKTLKYRLFPGVEFTEKTSSF